MKKLKLLSVAITLSICAFNQSVEINGVKGSRFEGVYPIIGGQDMASEGFYTYYLVEKEKGIKTFEFSLIDKAVTSVSKTQVSLQKWATINNTVFNGKMFLISWEEWKNKRLVLNVINESGEIVTNKNFPVEKRFELQAKVFPNNTGNGFYIVRKFKNKNTTGYSIEKVDNELNRIWLIEETPSKGVMRVLDLINTPDRLVVWQETGMSFNKLKPFIVSYEANTGAKVFEKDGYDGKTTILYNEMRLDDEGNLILGGAYVKGEKYRSVNNNGIYIKKYDKDGNEILYTKVDNKEKIQEALKATSKGLTVGSKDKVFVEDLILDGDDIIVISEMFRKNANITPMKVQFPRDILIGKFIGDIHYKNEQGNSPKVTFEIMDFMLFEFNAEGGLGQIKPIKKEDYNKITCYYPYVNYFGMDLAKAMYKIGWFDYAFTTTNSNDEKIMVCKNNASPRKPELFFYTMDQSYAQKKINLKKEGKIDLEKAKVSYFNALRAERGKVAVVYYQRNLSKITINLESIE